MKAVLEIESGRYSGRKRMISQGQVLEVGRGSMVDWSIPDWSISSSHFSVKCDADTCELHDLGSTNGTFLNGKRISQHLLRGGDQIRAGSTQVRVHLDCLRVDSTGQSDSEKMHRYSSSSQCPSEFWTARFTAPLARAAEQLSSRSRLHLIATADPASTDNQPIYLFDWLPRTVLARLSPVVLSPEASVGRLDRLKPGSFTCVFTNLAVEETCWAVRSLITDPATAGATADRSKVFQGGWALTLKDCLRDAPPDSVRRALVGIDGFLFQEGSSLEVFGGRDFVDFSANRIVPKGSIVNR